MNSVEEKQAYIVSARRDSAHATESNGPPVWLISFTDVIALMLTFFVLLYSMSEPDSKKFENKIGITAFSQAEFAGTQNQAGNDEGDNIARMNFNLAEDLQYIETLLNQAIQSRQMQNRIQIVKRGNLLLLYLDPSLESNNRDFLLFLNNIEPLLESLDNRIELVGKPEANGIFQDLQTLGRILKSYGYQHAISITIRDLSGSDMNPRMAIGIRSNDGRRVTR